MYVWLLGLTFFFIGCGAFVQCQAGHLMCDGCRCGNTCRSCGGATMFFRCPEVDIFIRCAKVRCPYASYGCRESIVYYYLGVHRVICPYRPRPCLQMGCALSGSPPVLRRHVCADHEWPLITLQGYGMEKSIFVPTADMKYLVTVEDDGASVFILTVRRGVPALAVSIEHYASNPVTGRHHKCTMHVLVGDPPRSPGGFGRRLTMETAVGSYTADAAEGKDGRLWLVVVPAMINTMSNTVHLMIRID